MRKVSSKITSLFLTFMMLISVISAPAVLAAETDNEITGFIWDVNSITGVKFARAFDDATNIQVLLAVYKDSELVSVCMKDVQTGVKNSEFDSSVTLTSGQTAKAFLWNVQSVEPLAKCYPITDAGEVDSSCQVVGTSKVILPADNATIRAKLNYALYDSELEENVSAKFTLTGSDLTGLSITEDGILTTTPRAKEGTVYVNAQYGCKVYQKELTLVKGYYDNFEDDTVDELPNAAGWSREIGVAQEENGNKYLDTLETYGRYNFSGDPNGRVTKDLTSDNVTLEWDVMFTIINSKVNKSNLMQLTHNWVDAEHKSGSYYWNINTRTNGNKVQLYRQWFRSGDAMTVDDYPYTVMGDFDTNRWINVKVQFNFEEQKYFIYFNGILENESGWDFGTEITDYATFVGILPHGFVDNINVYSGESYNPYEVDGISTLVAPADNANFTTGIKYSLVDKDGGAAVSGASFAIEGDVEGFSMASDGTLTATSDAKAGSIIVKAVYNGNVYTKEVAVKKGAFIDFENDTVGEKPVGWVDRAVVVAEETSGGNQYLDTLNTYGRYNFTEDLAGDSTTIEWDVRLTVTGDKVSRGSLLNLTHNWADAEHSTGSYYYDILARANEDKIELYRQYDESGTKLAWPYTDGILATIESGEWVNVKVVFNHEDREYSIYVDNNPVAENWKFESTITDYATLVGMLPYGDADNIRVYSGTRN